MIFIKQETVIHIRPWCKLNRSVHSADNPFYMGCNPPQHRNHLHLNIHGYIRRRNMSSYLCLLKTTYKAQIPKIIAFDMHMAITLLHVITTNRFNCIRETQRISVRRCFRIQVEDGKSMHTKGKTRKEQ